MTLTYSIADIEPFINWTYFYHAWGVSGRPSADRQQMKEEALLRLQRYANDYHTHALFRLFDAYSDGDDIVVGNDEGRIPCLRQQHGSECLCLADFVAPRDCPAESLTSPALAQIGVFATTVDSGMETDFHDDPYEQMMMQLLADRLAEATAERLHLDVRRHYWGYAPDEQLSMDDLLLERWQGIRPAVGYPSLPDTSLNFVLDTLLKLKTIGIRLTESGAMKPHASVSGLMLAHPEACYFSVGRVGEDQLVDYAHRRGLPVEVVRKFIGNT